MLTKPELRDAEIIACLHNCYDLRAVGITFLPIGADRSTAVYRAVADDGAPYFVKLRQGSFDSTSVELPKILRDQGIQQIIVPLMTTTGQLWANLDDYALILYPFVEGQDAYTVDLTDHHWIELGRALRAIHSARVPSELLSHIRKESYTPVWRNLVRTIVNDVPARRFDDPISVKLAALLGAKRAAILDLVDHAERAAQMLQARSPEFILCHADLHAGNILITADTFYIVDWDDPVLAPRERDLMFVGGGLLGEGHTAQEESILFYQGYGPTQIDPAALTYYRCERIVQDIAVFCEEILLTDESSADRAQSLHYLASNFVPGGTIDIAYQCSPDTI